MSFSCFLIGADTLLLECGEILLTKGHTIAGVVAGSTRVADWARRKGLPVHDVKSAWSVELAKTSFDYLFSITHLALLPEDVLRLPKKGAINFHDGPLPRFAGLNTPVWAIAKGEESYGISWHVVTPGIDEGDVLAERSFEISPSETALSLNTKNFGAAIESFAELVDALEAGTETRRPQDLSVERFTFSRHDRPDALALLDLSRPAAELERWVRALDTGRYPNPVGSLKLVHGDHAVIVAAAEVRDDEDGEPGQVLAAEDHELVLRAGEGALAITRFTSLGGVELTPGQVAAHLGLAPGATIAALDDDARAALTALGRTLSKGERFFERRLAALEPVELPWSKTERAEHVAEVAALALATPSELGARFTGDARAAALVAAYAATLARLSGKDEFHVDLRDAGAEALSPVARRLVEARVPLQVGLDPAQGFDKLHAAITAELASLRAKVGYLRDLVAREPELQSNPALVKGRGLPLGVVLAADAGDVLGAAGGLAAGATLELVVTPDGAHVRYDRARVDAPDAEAFARCLEAVLAAVAHAPSTPVATVDLLGEAVRRRVLHDWNATDVDYPRDACVHHLFEAQVDRTPDRTALVFEDRAITYAELDARANQLAAYLAAQGVGPDTLVGVYVERSIELVLAVLGTQKAGGAYVPLDPTYPRDRIEHMIADSGCPVILTTDHLLAELPPSRARVVSLDGDWGSIGRASTARVRSAATPANVAYCIYTSGSTGKPKGVLVEHRNVVNFFTGMDARIDHATPATWFAVTSLSFDISVLELSYTLTRGFSVVVYLDRDKKADAALPHAHVGIDFSLFYFSGDEAADHGPGKYRLLMEGARWADERGYKAVWTPERHFHAFGGLYPHPAVTGAAVAAITKKVQIRSGSVVLPLHHPIRVAEAWSVVDNLSNGRVGISVASGWQPNDFVLMPQNYKDAKNVMFRDLELVQKLWRGEEVEFPGATGSPVKVKTLPRPVQPELPTWVTTAGNPDTYIQAGRIGANLLTHLLGQSVEQLGPKIELYRQARKEAGFDPDTGVVSLMLHTFVGPDEGFVREQVREPLKQYLGTSLSLLKQYAWAFPAFQKPKNADAGSGDEFSSLTPEEHDAVLEFAYLRYYETSGLFGTPESVQGMIDTLKSIGVDEIACLIDFGVKVDVVLENLPYLDDAKRRANASVGKRTDAALDLSPAAQLKRHGVTHMQCTPSMARMLTMHDDARAALADVKHLMVGGEAFPVALAKDLVALVGKNGGDVTNMYGPTETTIWSTTWRLGGELESISIGTPIANTQIYILDKNLQPLPPGVAGELWIGGDGVVRGYHQRPELTAERFVRDPFRTGTADRPARMYRTGDLARWRPLADGTATIDFLGRVDHQVKIRGYRIELGEIEAQLGHHPGVRECVVVLREETAGDQQLVAFASAKNGVTLDAAEVKEHLRKALPEFMVPAHVVVLEELPHTPNGKIDRKQLPSLQSVLGKRTAATAFVAAESDVEQRVLSVWQETLGKDEIGVDDNFFDIGGHSLLVVRMHRRLKEVVERPLSLTDLYRFPTIRGFAEFLASDGSSDSAKAGADRAARRKQSMERRRGVRR